MTLTNHSHALEKLGKTQNEEVQNSTLQGRKPKHLKCGKTGKYQKKDLKHTLNHGLQMNQQEDTTVGWK